MDELTPQVQAEIAMAGFLIRLGVVAVEKVREVFQKDVNDDAVLDQIMSDVNARIARRS